MNMRPLFFCISCKTPLIFNHKSIIDYFLVNEFSSCPECSAEFDLFESIAEQIKINFMNDSIYGFIGAKTKIVKINLYESSSIELNLMEKGVPSNAKLLHLNYTPQGNFLPIDVNGNEPLNINKSLIRVIRTFKLSQESCVNNELNCMVTYIETNSDYYEGIKNLVDAFVDYQNKDFKSAIIPANVAVEFPLKLFMKKIFTPIVSEKKLKSFSNKTDYSDQLNILLPYVCKKEGFIMFNNKILAQLNSLRKFRNEVAHSGNHSIETNKAEMSKVLTAALFGNIYLGYLIKKIQLL